MYIFSKNEFIKKRPPWNQYMSFLIEDDKLLEKSNENYKSIKKKFDSEPVYNEKYLRTKIKSYKGKINTNFTVIKYQKKALNVFFFQ